jgi:hypothetical protein
LTKARPSGLVTAAVLAVVFAASAAQAGISGSAHDWGYFKWSNNQICLPCHTLHNATVKDSNGNELAGPLWNHTLPVNSYTLYTATTAKTKDANGQPVLTGSVDQNSILCLSCHDGTIALDSFGGGPNKGQEMTNVKMLVGLGGNLSDDHPIGEAAIWPTPNPSYMVNPSLRDAQRIMPLRPMADGRLAVGCTSCHEPHNRTNIEHLLWVNNKGPITTVDGRQVAGSGLCLNCHIK